MFETNIKQRLNKLLKTTHVKEIQPEDKVVIFSDLHMGNGGKGDDFLKNGDFFSHILENYYLKNNYQLILNGDVEELQRFSLKKIIHRWQKIYDIFDIFYRRGRLVKHFGNHDYHLSLLKNNTNRIKIHETLKLIYKKNPILVFHGHQANRLGKLFFLISSIVLRIIANPLRIKNYSVAYNSRRKYAVEKRVYNFAKGNKLLAIIGHTHRPLFESLSKIDSLRFKIEQLCRIYPETDPETKSVLENKIVRYKNELQTLMKKKKNPIRLVSSLYNSEPLVPCIFNSGCVIGKSGMTSIEIYNGKISLVHWFEGEKIKKYFDQEEEKPKRLGNSSYYRLILKQETLDYIFTRIKLLS
jgi:UDP-2,3-diacylglucosamine pyrophosphatase LpxH